MTTKEQTTHKALELPWAYLVYAERNYIGVPTLYKIEGRDGLWMLDRLHSDEWPIRVFDTARGRADWMVQAPDASLDLLITGLSRFPSVATDPRDEIPF